MNKQFIISPFVNIRASGNTEHLTCRKSQTIPIKEKNIYNLKAAVSIRQERSVIRRVSLFAYGLERFRPQIKEMSSGAFVF